jgi:formyltetrahydrofolate deformylase
MHCPDGPGIVHFVSGLVAKKLGGNITSTQELIISDLKNGKTSKEFFLRVAWEMRRGAEKEEVFKFFSQNLKTYKAVFSIDDADRRDRLALFATREAHCLIEVLAAHYQEILPAEIPIIISNHEHDKVVNLAHMFNVNFYHVPYDGKDNAKKKESALKKQMALLQDYEIDVIGLARYMQIVPQEMIKKFQSRIVNIHHSFLPAFAGARPYHQAYERGVKKIGATAHFVTARLDEGPIIEQDTEEVVDQSSVDTYIEIGRGIEKRVFLSALRKYLERKLIVYGNKVIVFI